MSANAKKLIDEKNWKGLVSFCESFEFESAASSNNNNQNLYGVHLFAYFLVNDLNNARFLWKRIGKNGDAETSAVWNIGREMWKKNHEGVYVALNSFTWNPVHAQLAQELVAVFRERTFVLLSKAFTNITGKDTAAYLGLNQQQAVQFVEQRGWVYDKNNDLLQVKPFEQTKVQMSDLTRLGQLADYFTYLESN
eukprot:TRINITY_DN9619_c0_g1_i1.p1 TRINITY_DN9619_c0_g1~~TRINITY_DN9619_c0_g1_i1.p1  ORF type:complete len:194 (-),score=46.72 TRINITY_DN9619_c0_g1_i1:76-657(-)